MKVKCINICNERTKEHINTSPWLTIGKEYLVLEMSVYPGKKILYRLPSDENNSPVLFDSAQFEVVSGKIPTTWVIDQSKYSLTLSPLVWKKSGFWEDVFNYEDSAIEIYKKEARKILEEEE